MLLWMVSANNLGNNQNIPNKHIPSFKLYNKRPSENHFRRPLYGNQQPKSLHHNLRKRLAVILAFIGNRQCNVECRIGIKFGNGGMVFLQSLSRTAIHRFAHCQCERQLPQKRHVQPFSQGLAAVAAENCFAMAAVGADVYRHIFQHAENRDIDFIEHIHRLACVYQCDVLRRGNDHRAGNGDFLRQGKLNIARTRRQIDKQLIHIVPFALKQ